MKRLLKFKLDEAADIYIETDSDSDHAERVGRTQDIVGEATDQFDVAVSRIVPAAEAVLRAMEKLNTPNEISLEFGVKFGAKAGAILASVDSEATFKVSVKWARK